MKKFVPMRCDAVEARKFFESLSCTKKIRTMHPDYVLADAIRDEKLEPFLWCDHEGGNSLYHAGQLCRIPGTEYFDLQSAYGYGGPVCSYDSTESMNIMWERYHEWCRSSGVVVEFVRFHPMQENWHGYPGRVISQRETVWVDLTLENLMAGYQTRARTATRKALKLGVRVEWFKVKEFVKFFPKFYRQAMSEIGADESYLFPDAYFEALLRMDGVHCGVCLHADEIVAAAIFFSESKVMEYHLSASSITGKRLGASNILLHEASLLGQSIGCDKLYLGGGNDNSDDNRLLFFKKGFSKRRALFQIGCWHHLSDAYESLKQIFPEAYERNPGRVLFYR